MALFLKIRMLSGLLTDRDLAGPDQDHRLVFRSPAACLDVGAVDTAVAGEQVPLNDVEHGACLQVIMIPHISGMMRCRIAMAKFYRALPEPGQCRCVARQQGIELSLIHI